jgi:7-carboxy-7-deazaguanine synthase
MKVNPVKSARVSDLSERLPVAEIFSSINGEGLQSGSPATFIRLAGCNLACSWCDTAWANVPDAPAMLLTPEECYRFALDKGIQNVTITGGEPLLCPNIIPLIRTFARDPFFFTEIETNGSLPLENLRRAKEHIAFTVDCKLPSSGMADRMNFRNFGLLGKRDCVKFVIGSEEDLTEAARIMKDMKVTERTNVIFSPVFGKIEPVRIAEFLIENALDARLGLQLHKILWGNERKR